MAIEVVQIARWDADLLIEQDAVHAMMIFVEIEPLGTELAGQVLAWCIRRGCRHISFVGQYAEITHDMFDDLVTSANQEIFTTWHEDESAFDTANFFLFYFNMIEGASGQFIVLIEASTNLQDRVLCELSSLT
jgi:hypothetical protein